MHPEENWRSLCPVGADNRRNLCASDICGDGNVDAVLASCDEVVDRVYTRACQQANDGDFPHLTLEIDHYGRLHIVSSTQIVFSMCGASSLTPLDIPKSKIHVEKPRIGGGFGAKQTVVAEVYPALVTWKTGKPAKMIYSREECQIAGSPRHEMEVHVRVGANKDGVIRAIDVYTLSNTGAFGEHGPTTVGLSGHKSIPLYTGNLEAFRFAYDVVYTNVQAAGAYRGYGATQGIFAVESAVSEAGGAAGYRPGCDPRKKNMVREGRVMAAYYNEPASACALDRCMARCKELFGWDGKYPVRDMGNEWQAPRAWPWPCKARVSRAWTWAPRPSLERRGLYNLMIGAADMGTGCDTILAQMAAECPDCSVDDIAVFGADSDASPYDSGS